MATPIDPNRHLARIQRFRLIDDAFFHTCFNDYMPGMELLLRIVYGKADLKVTSMVAQNKVPNIYGREVCFDVFARDTSGKLHDFEVQRSDVGAVPLRARYNSSMLDTMEVQKGIKWKDLPPNGVIFLTENDVLGGNLPLYHIRRKIEELDNAPFEDNTEIIYVNGAYVGKDPVGMLIHDFQCTDPRDMHYEVLADRANFFKNDKKGVTTMSEIVEEILNEGREEGREEGEERLGRLVAILSTSGKHEEVTRAAVDRDYRNAMYQQYNIA